MRQGESIYLYPATGLDRVVVWRTPKTTWVLTPPTDREDANTRARQAGDLLRPHERQAICDAYGASDWWDLSLMTESLPCRGCFVPSALRPPGVPWPECECMEPVPA